MTEIFYQCKFGTKLCLRAKSEGNREMAREAICTVFTCFATTPNIVEFRKSVSHKPCKLYGFRCHFIKFMYVVYYNVVWAIFLVYRTCLYEPGEPGSPLRRDLASFLFC